jgi:hypothetical protein
MGILGTTCQLRPQHFRDGDGGVDLQQAPDLYKVLPENLSKGSGVSIIIRFVVCNTTGRTHQRGRTSGVRPGGLVPCGFQDPEPSINQGAPRLDRSIFRKSLNAVAKWSRKIGVDDHGGGGGGNGGGGDAYY